MNKQADKGNLFVCCACGKISKWKYGFDDEGNHEDVGGERYASWCWDASCMMHAVELPIDTLVFEGGRVIKGG